MTIPRRVAAVLPAALLIASFGAAAQTAPSTTPAAAPSSVRPAAAMPARPGTTTSATASAAAQSAAPRAAAGPAAPQAGGAPDAESIFASWDRDKNRSLSLEEFKAGWQRARESQVVSRLAAQFRNVDANHNGQLEPAEYANLPLFKRAGSAAPPLSTFDTNGSNSLDNQEYLRMVEALVRTAEAQGGN